MTGSEKQWLEQSFRHPEQLEQALNFLELNDEQGYDVYVCPYLGGNTEPNKGRVGVALPGPCRRGSGAPCGGRLPRLGGFVVWSGSPRDEPTSMCR